MKTSKVSLNSQFLKFIFLLNIILFSLPNSNSFLKIQFSKFKKKFALSGKIKIAFSIKFRLLKYIFLFLLFDKSKIHSLFIHILVLQIFIFSISIIFLFFGLFNIANKLL